MQCLPAAWQNTSCKQELNPQTLNDRQAKLSTPIFDMSHLIAQKIIDMPWRLQNEVRRRAAIPYLKLVFALNGINWGRKWRVLGKPIIQRHRKSRIELGDGVVLRSWTESNPLVPIHPVVFSTRSDKAVISVGKDCGFTGTTIVAADRVQIGNRVQVGANTTIVDTDFHPLTPEGRKEDMANGKNKPVIIHDDVFIGMNCLILKGVEIGEGSVVGAGSVVSKHVPPRTMVGGNPARIIREL